jgi:hypothetical protein
MQVFLATFGSGLAAKNISLPFETRQFKEINRPEEICYTRVEPTEDRPHFEKSYIFISAGKLDEDVGVRCDKFENEQIARVFQGHALFLDLRGRSPDLRLFRSATNCPNIRER